MPYGEQGRNPETETGQALENLTKKYFTPNDKDIPQASLDLVLATGKDIIIRKDSDGPDEKYLALKNHEEGIKTNNLENHFEPRMWKDLDLLFNELRECDPSDTPEIEDVIEMSSLRPALYYLAKEKYLLRAFQKLGLDQSRRFMVINEKISQIRQMPDQHSQAQSMLTDEYQAIHAERATIAGELYVILHELGVNTEQLDK